MSSRLLSGLILAISLTGCTSVRMDMKELSPTKELLGNLPVKSSLQVYTAVPYIQEGSARFLNKSYAYRKIHNRKKLQETSLNIAKKYFSDVQEYNANNETNYFIFFTGNFDTNNLLGLLTSTVRGQVYNGQGKLIYDETVSGREITGGGLNDASLYNAVSKAQINFYDKLFKSSYGKLNDTDSKISAYKLVNKIDRSLLRSISSATGYIINKDGNIITNRHAVNNCLAVKLIHDGKEYSAKIEHLSSDYDLAILDSTITTNKFAVFSHNNYKPRLGEDIVVIGYPLQGVLTSKLSLTKGNISALAGINDNDSMYQITAPVQKGNSGGPLLNMSGRVIGVIQSKLDAVLMANYTGDIPQNVNFAIKKRNILNFLRKNQTKYATANKRRKISTPDVADAASLFTVNLSCIGYVDILI